MPEPPAELPRRRFVGQEAVFPAPDATSQFRYVGGEPRASVTAVTAVGDGLCSLPKEHPDVRQSVLRATERDRNEHPLLVALVAIVAAWSIVFLLGL